MRNEGSSFAANIYRAMPEGSIQVTSHKLQVTSHKSLVTSHLAPLIPSHASLLSNFRVQGCGAAHKNMEAPQSFEDMVFTKDEKPVNLLNLQNPFNL